MKTWILDEEMDAANEREMTATAAVHGVKPVRDTLADPGPYRLNAAFELARNTATELVALQAENLRLRGLLEALEKL